MTTGPYAIKLPLIYDIFLFSLLVFFTYVFSFFRDVCVRDIERPFCVICSRSSLTLKYRTFPARHVQQVQLRFNYLSIVIQTSQRAPHSFSPSYYTGYCTGDEITNKILYERIIRVEK